MRIKWMISAVCVGLAGCNAVSENLQRANDKAQKAVFKTTKKFLHYTNPELRSKMESNAPQTAFCYESLSDIICYDAPQDDINNPMVGFQGYVAQPVPARQVALSPGVAVTGGPERTEIVDAYPAEYKPVNPIPPASMPLEAGGPTPPSASDEQTEPQPVSEAPEVKVEKKTGDPQPLMPRY